MTTPILVTGGTGTLGRPVAQRLRDAGASVTVLSRHPRETAEGIRYTAGDLSTGWMAPRTTPLQMPRCGKGAPWSYDRVAEGLTKTAGQCPERAGGPGGGRAGASAG